jgi:hypothetical protein
MTQDIDFLIHPSKENARRLMCALEEFGFGKAGIPQEYFEKAGTAVHLGVEPNRIDLLTHLVGIDNETIFGDMKQMEYENMRVNVISLGHLLSAKQKSGRTRDKADYDELKRLTSGRDCTNGDSKRDRE